MCRNGSNAKDGRVPRRDDRRGSGDDLDAIGPGEQGACYDGLGVGGGIVEGERALPYAGRRVAGPGGRHALALCGAADFQEACGNLLACLLRRTCR